MWVEDKGYGFALHYRDLPEHESAVIALAAEIVDAFDGPFEVQPGVLVQELRPAVMTKVRHSSNSCPSRRSPGRPPIVVGDDRTDEFAFAAAQAWEGSASSSETVTIPSRRSTSGPRGCPRLAGRDCRGGGPLMSTTEQSNLDLGGHRQRHVGSLIDRAGALRLGLSAPPGRRPGVLRLALADRTRVKASSSSSSKA